MLLFGCNRSSQPPAAPPAEKEPTPPQKNERQNQLVVPPALLEVLGEYEKKSTPLVDSLDSDALMVKAKKELEKDPKDNWFRLFMAVMYAGNKQFRKAIDLYGEAAAHDPDAAEPYIGIAEIYLSLIDFDLVRRGRVEFKNDLLYQRIDEPAKKLLLEAKTLVERAGRLKMTAVRGKDGITTRTFSPDSLMKLSKRIDKDIYRYWVEKGVEMERAEKPSEAFAAFEEATRLAPVSYTAHYGKGCALFNLNKYDVSLSVLDDAIRLQPNSRNALQVREIVRLKQYGLEHSPTEPKVRAFLTKDLESKDRKIQLGAALLIKDKDLLLKAMENHPNLQQELAAVLQWKDKHYDGSDIEK